MGLALVKLFASRFSRAEKIFMAVLLSVVVASSGALMIWKEYTGTVQPLPGGVFVEGVVGKPQVINPLYARANTAEGDITKLVFAGLVKINAAREFVPDLAESWEVQNKGKSYVFKLRENLVWQDGEKLDADDVIFTIQVLQDDAYAGPYRADWNGVTAVAVDFRTVRIDLPDPSTFFLAHAAIGILPAHLFGLFPVAEIGEASSNEKPIGAGPYQIIPSSPGQETVNLEPNPHYHGGKALIEKIIFTSFDSEKEMLTALANGNITAAGFSGALSEEELSLANLNKFVYNLPQYKAVFFNQMSSNKVLAEAVVRQALAYATNKTKIIKNAAGNNAVAVESPVLPGFWGHLPDIKKYDFDLAAAANLLTKSGWKDVDGDQILEKNNQRLSLALTFKDDKSNTAIAGILEENWKAIGAEVKLNPVNSSDLVNQIIRPRSYEALIFGQSLGADSDPYAYWHSSQTADPGLALSVMYDKDIDNPLEMARLSSDLGRAIGYYHNFQKSFANTVPAILLYQPNYTYLVNAKVKGDSESINLSTTADRFMDIEKWYVRSKKTI